MDRSYAATSIGTTLLLIAAAIVVLTFVFRGPLWHPNLGIEQQVRERTGAASKEISARPLEASAFPLGAASTSSALVARTERSSGERYDPAGSFAAVDDKRQALKAATTPSTSELDPDPLRTFKEEEPLAATRCVYVYNPGSDAKEWKIVNGCGIAVGVALSDRSIVLPAPGQRPLTLEEQTVHADNVRYTACFVATLQARTLIGAPREERSTPAWREQFEAARMNDGCLLRLQNLVY
jgi:hypothetical protein